MRKLCILLSCSALLVAAPAFAQKKATKKKSTATQTKKSAISDKDKEGTEGYGMAGCGLGSLIWGEQEGSIQIAAGILNYLGGQSFAITSGTSNCKPDMYNFKKNAQLFITVNKEILAKDISRGNGETIASLAEIMGCSDANVLGGKLQQNYNTIFPSQETSADDASRQIFDLIKTDGELAKNCAKIS